MTTLNQKSQDHMTQHLMSEQEYHKMLVIGYGNTLRGDDGVGYQIAEALQDMNLNGVKAIPCHQLMPELSAAIAQTQTVIFVDAAIASTSTETDIILTHLSPDETLPFTTHAATPHALLSLTKWLYGATPIAYQLTIPAVNFEIGEAQSSITKSCRLLALEQLRQLCQES